MIFSCCTVKMATSITKITRLLFRDIKPICVICSRNTAYDKNHVENTRTLEQIKEPLAEDDIRRFSRIKAARTDDNTFTDFDPVVHKFINMLLRQGKKAVARENVYKAFEYVKRAQVEKYHKASEEEKPHIEIDPVRIFHQALENGKPLLITKKVKKAGQIYQVPVAASEIRQNFLTMKWLILASSEKHRKVRFYDKLGQEILDAYNHQGGLIRKKQEMHKLCETNRAFAQLAG